MVEFLQMLGRKRRINASLGEVIHQSTIRWSDGSFDWQVKTFLEANML